MHAKEQPFGVLLKRYRLAAGLSQANLAERAHLSARGISDLERGARRAPRQATVQRLIDALQLDPADQQTLLTGIHRYRLPRPVDAPLPGYIDDLQADETNVVVPSPEEDYCPLGGIVPAQPTVLFGRQQELESIRRRLTVEHVRLLTLTGPAGVGKTRLALEVAGCVADHFPDGVTVIDLAPVRDPRLVLPTIAQTLGMMHVDNRPLLAQVQGFLRDRTALLILDNFEQVLPAAPHLAEILAFCAGITLLVTSRSPLRLQWEQTIPVSPLATPAPDQMSSLDALGSIPSVELFVQRSRARQPDFALTPDNARLVAELCMHLDGLPLAIELAAARMNVLPLSAIAGRLEHRLLLLDWQGADLPDRHRSLEAAVGWSYDLLTGPEQRLFRHLGVFAGRASLDAIETVLGDDDEDQVLTRLASLVEKSLVIPAREDEETELSFGVLETMRGYACEQLEHMGEIINARGRHAFYFVELAERAVPHLHMHDQFAWFARLEREHDNLRITLRWLLDHGEPESALRLAGALGYFWWARGYLEEACQWLDETLHNTPPADSSVRTRALLQAGLILPYRGDYARSKEVLEEALSLAQDRHDRSDIAAALTYLGTRAAHAGEWIDSARLLREALASWEELGDRYQIGFALFFLGLAQFMQGDYVGAAALQTDAMAQHRAIGDVQTSGGTHFYLALAVHKLGDLPRSVALLGEGLRVAASFQNRWLMSIGVEAVLLLVGDRVDARTRARLLGAGDALRRATGFLQGIWGQSEPDESISTLRRQLAQRSFLQAYRAGETLSLEEVAALARAILDEFSHTLVPAQSMREHQSRGPALSRREQEVLHLVAEGLSNKAIARRLFISPSTVSYHLSSIFNKLGVDTRVQALVATMQHDTFRDPRPSRDRS